MSDIGQGELKPPVAAGEEKAAGTNSERGEKEAWPEGSIGKIDRDPETGLASLKMRPWRQATDGTLFFYENKEDWLRYEEALRDARGQ